MWEAQESVLTIEPALSRDKWCNVSFFVIKKKLMCDYVIEGNLCLIETGKYREVV